MGLQDVVYREPRSRFIDMTGWTCGQLTVVSFAGFDGTMSVWNCLCQCGTECRKYAISLRHPKGAVVSCGCSARRAGRPTVHGMSASQTYKRWISLRKRDIAMCERWRASFVDFLADVGECPGDAYFLDRTTDPTGVYEPGNAKWVLWSEAISYTKSRRYLTFDGRTMSCADWAREIGISRQCLEQRLLRRPPESVLAQNRGELPPDIQAARKRSIAT